MIGYICKYAPIEIFNGFDENVSLIEPNILGFENSDSIMHPNVCSYTKGVLEHILKNEYDGIILTNCCDSMRRLYDVLKSKTKSKFIYLIDIPRKNNDLSPELLKSEILKLIKSYENFSKKKFNTQKFLNELSSDSKDKCTIKKLDTNIKKNIKCKLKTNLSHNNSNINIGILGARYESSIFSWIKDKDMNISFDLTCNHTKHNFNINLKSSNILKDYSKELLSQNPCMRMENAALRFNYLKNFKNIDGLIYHTVKFCDNYSFEYATLKNKLQIPILKIETDYTNKCAGQIKTRVQAFMESIKSKKTTLSTLKTNKSSTSPNLKKITLKENNNPSLKKYVLGIDSGSTSTNAVIMDSNKNIIAFSVIKTGAKSYDSAEKAMSDVLKKANLKRDDLKIIVSTGYGRVSIPFADMTVTEISCHGKGAHFLNSNVRTILDIGGQDSKVIRLNENGDVVDFVMNDKCAAGTGRFLETMAKILEVDINDMGPLSLKYKEDLNISSMCTVFAESEVISLIAQNKETADIIHGLNKSVATKATSLIKRVSPCGEYMMTGGVAKNIGVVKTIEEKLNQKLFIWKEPELVGAIGAAIEGISNL